MTHEASQGFMWTTDYLTLYDVYVAHNLLPFSQWRHFPTTEQNSFRFFSFPFEIIEVLNKQQ